MSYANRLQSWFGDISSSYGKYLPAGSPYYSMLSSSLQSAGSFNYGNTKPVNEWQLYAMAMHLYLDVLRSYYNKMGSQNNEEHVYHWKPVSTPNGTTIIDVNSGRRVYVRNSRHGREIIGTAKDVEYNFGRGMAAEAVKMAYDDDLYSDARPYKQAA